MEMRALFSLAAVVTALAACGQSGTNTVMSVALPTEARLMRGQFQTDVLNKLAAEDKELLLAYLTRKNAVAGLNSIGVQPGTTVGAAIDAQKRLLANVAMAKSPRDGAAPSASQSDLQEIVHVSLQHKEIVPGNLLPQQRLELVFTNNAAKAIAGVDGNLAFVDMFGNTIESISIQMTESIAVADSTLWTGSRDYNEFVSAHRAVAQLEEGKYTTLFIFKTIVFSDGTQLTAKQ